MDGIYKQRIVGAIVLTALAVIFVPMVFQTQDDLSPTVHLTARVPSAPVAKAPDAVHALEDKVHAEVGLSQAEQLNIQHQFTISQNQSVETHHPSVAKTETTTPVIISKNQEMPPHHLSVTKAEAASPGTTASHTEASTNAGAYLLQVASFQQQQSADKLITALQTKGFHAFTQTTAKTGKSDQPRFRVVIGPVIAEADVDALREKVESNFHLHGIIVNYHAEA